MLKIPGNAYGDFSRIFNFPGSEGLEGIQQEVVPTQDLSRLLQYSQAQSCQFKLQIAPAASQLTTYQFDDVSDWDSVTINGITITTDAECPQKRDVRILTNVFLEVAGATTSEYTSCEITRIDDTGAQYMVIAAFGGLVAGHVGAPLTSPSLFPQVLGYGGRENTIVINQVVTGANTSLRFTFCMISAPPGVFHPHPGV
jgi:hypothetical protein